MFFLTWKFLGMHDFYGNPGKSVWMNCRKNAMLGM